MGKFKPFGCWILIGILAGSVILGLYRINDCQMTVDEFFSINIAQRSLGEIWSLRKDPGFYFNSFPPLYETILHFVWFISNESLFWARLLSVFFNLAALYLIFMISKLLFDKTVGLVAAFFASLNYSYIFFSKMIRCYSFLNFLTLASFYIFFKVLFDKGSGNRYKIILVFVNIAMLYTFYFGAIVILLELILSCAFLSGRVLKNIWLWLISSFIFFLPWLPRFLDDFSIKEIVRFRISAAYNFFNIALDRFSQGIFHSQGLLIFYFAVALSSLIYGFVLFRRKDKKGVLIIALAAIFLASVFIINYLTAGMKDGSRARYSFPYIFPVFILTGVFIKQKRRYAGILIFSALLTYSAVAINGYFRSPVQQFWPAQLAPLVVEAREFPVKNSEKVTIEIETGFFVPVFVYYFYGPAYFRDSSFPFGGANLTELSAAVKTNYQVYSNIASDKRFQFLLSIPNLERSDWLFLIYSNWLATSWGKPFRRAYEEKLTKYGLQDSLSLVKKKSIGAFTLEIYKVKKSN